MKAPPLFNAGSPPAHSADTHQTPSSSLSFLAATQRSTEPGSLLNPPALQQLRRGTSETSPHCLWISARSTGTRRVAQTPSCGNCWLKGIFSILASSQSASSFLPMPAMPPKGQKPRHQCQKQNLIHAALLTRQSSCWPSARQLACACFDN